MRQSTIAYPALLGHANRFGREMARMAAQVRSPGLFDLAVDADGLLGHTQSEREAVRAFQMLGEAFGLHGKALLEWHRVFARDEQPRIDGPLLQCERRVLADLLLRAQTLALYQDRDGRAAGFMRVWRRAKPLRDRVRGMERLGDELRAYAPHLMALVPEIQEEIAPRALGGLRDVRRALMEFGLTPAGWRWLVAHPPLPRPEREAPSYPGERAILMANTFSAVGPGFAPDEQFRNHALNLAREALKQEDPLDDRPWLLNCAWRYFQSIEGKDDREYFLLSSFRRVSQWAIDTGWSPDANQLRVGWAAIEKAWRRDIGAERGPFVAWPVPFESVEHCALVACPIANSHALWAEGQAMGHCIGDYTARAVNGTFLPLSVRGPGGERVATFSFERDSVGEPWRQGACKGRFNQDVTDERVWGLVRAAFRDMDAGSSPA